VENIFYWKIVTWILIKGNLENNFKKNRNSIQEERKENNKTVK
jgi:hypothetical protein